MDDDIDDIITCSSSGDDRSDVDTAVPFISDVHLIRSDMTQQLSDSTSIETEACHLEEMQNDVQILRKRGEIIRLQFVEKLSEVPKETTLKSYLDENGPFPLAHSIAAFIIKEICSGLLYLHQRKQVHGCLAPDTIVFDSQFRAHVVVPSTIRNGENNYGFGRGTLSDDMFRLGEIIYRLVTGHHPHFDKGDNPSPLPPLPYNIPKEIMDLANILLSKFPALRPTAGTVLYHPWIEKNGTNPKNIMIL